MLRRLPFVFVLLLVAPPGVAAQDDPAEVAYERVQQARASAESLWSKGDTRGITALEEMIAWLDQPGQLALAQGNIWFAARTANVWYDIARARLATGDPDGAVDAMRQVVHRGGSPEYLDFVAKDTAFAAIRDRADFQGATAPLRSAARRWGDSAFITPERPELPVEERLAGLALFWAEARYGFISFDLVPELDWDSAYVATIPRVIAARDTWEYYTILREFAALLRDSHTGVSAPRGLRDSLWVRPPLTTRVVENRVLITDTPPAGLRALGLAEGQEITAIDGIPVHEYVQQHVMPTVAWATPQDRMVRAYWYEMLRGPAARPVVLGIREDNGTAREVTVPRTGVAGELPAPVEARRLEDGIGYIALNTFNIDSIPERYDSALASLGDIRALVLDVRRNGGGNSSAGWNVLRRLAARPVPITRYRLQAYVPTYRAWRRPTPMPIWGDLDSLAPLPGARTDLPVAVLIGPATFSAAEDFAAAFRMMDRGQLIGEATGGNTGQPLSFPLPGGGFARVRTKHDAYQDGSDFIGVGIQPHVAVAPTVAGVRAGRDEVLDRAVRELGGP